MTWAKTTTVRCAKCGAEMGKSDGKKLTVENLQIVYAVQLCCAKCGRKFDWKPGREKKTVAPKA